MLRNKYSHETGIAHSKWGKTCFNLSYEWFCFIFPRVNDCIAVLKLVNALIKHALGLFCFVLFLTTKLRTLGHSIDFSGLSEVSVKKESGPLIPHTLPIKYSGTSP